MSPEDSLDRYAIRVNETETSDIDALDQYALKPQREQGESSYDIFSSPHLQEVERRFGQGLRALGSGLGSLPETLVNLPQNAAMELYRLFAGEYPTPSGPGTASYETAQGLASPLDYLPSSQDIQSQIDQFTGGKFAPQSSQEEFVSQLLTGAGAGAPFGPLGAAFGAASTQVEPALEYAGAPERVKAAANLLMTAAPAAVLVPRGTKPTGLSTAKLKAFERMGVNPASRPLFTEGAEIPRAQRVAQKTNVAKQAFQKDLREIGKASKEGIENLANRVSTSSFEDLSVADMRLPIPESLKGTALSEIQGKVSPSESALSSADLVTNAIDTTIEALRSEARNQYRMVDEIAGQEVIDPASVVRSAEGLKKRLERTGAFKADVTKKVLSGVNDLLNEISYPTSDGKFVSQEVPISKVTALKQEINRIQNFDVPDQGLKNELGRIGQELNTLVRDKLAENPAALEAYNTAEALWAEQGEKFGTKSPSVYKARFETRAPEEMFNAKNPSEIRDFARALEDTEQGQQAFSAYLKEVLKRNQGANDIEFLSEVQRVVPEQFKGAVEEQIKVIDPTSDITIESRNLDTIRKDIVEGLRVSGELPKYIGDLTGTLKGRQTLRKALGNSPEAKAVMKSLDKAYLNRIIDQATVTKNGQTLIDIDFLRNLAKNKSTEGVFREIMGQEGVQFMQDLGTIAESVHEVLQKYPDIQSPTNKLLDHAILLGLRYIIPGSLGNVAVGVKGGIDTASSAYASILLNKRARGAMKDLQRAKKMPDTKAKFALISNSLKTIQEEIDEFKQ